MLFMIANRVLAIFPPTRLFGIKRAILNRLGISVGADTRICGDVRFFGGGRVRKGSGCWIGIGTKFYTVVGKDIVIGDRCDIAPEVCFMCGSQESGMVEMKAGAAWPPPAEILFTAISPKMPLAAN